MQLSASIGIFDSGIGGLSIAKSIHRILPNENIIYVADSLYAPYGDKTAEFIERRSRQVIEFLLSHQVKIIVVACNTATVSSIEKFRQTYNIPFVGVEPGIKPAASLSKTGAIGVMATKRTLESEQFSLLIRNFAAQKKVVSQACVGLVEQIEKLQLDTQETMKLLTDYLTPILTAGADQIVLGCTHYSFVKPSISKIVKDKANIIDTSEAVAKQLVRQLERLELNNPNQTVGTQQFFSSDDLDKFSSILTRLWENPSKAKLF
jgi:glutamate racemase